MRSHGMIARIWLTAGILSQMQKGLRAKVYKKNCCKEI